MDFDESDIAENMDDSETVDNSMFVDLEFLEEFKKIKDLQSEINKLSDIVVQKQMIACTSSSLDADPNRKCNRPCGQGENLCGLCDHVFSGSVIINRRDITQSYFFKEHLQCNSFKQGMYGLFCVKENCPMKGLIYVGESENINNRILTHKHTIENSNPCQNQYIVNHFQQHKLKIDEKPSDYFKFALIKEEKGGVAARRMLENNWMTRFGTRGNFGLNFLYSRMKNELPTLKPKPSTSKSRSEAGKERQKSKPRQVIVSEGILIALAIRNQNSPTGVPILQISTFLDNYIKDYPVSHKSIVTKLRDNFNKGRPYYQTYPWITGEKNDKAQWSFKLDEINFKEEIDEEIDSNKHDLSSILIDPTVLDEMCSGNLPPITRVANRSLNH